MGKWVRRAERSVGAVVEEEDRGKVEVEGRGGTGGGGTEGAVDALLLLSEADLR